MKIPKCTVKDCTQDAVAHFLSPGGLTQSHSSEPFHCAEHMQRRLQILHYGYGGPVWYESLEDFYIKGVELMLNPPAAFDSKGWRARRAFLEMAS